MRNYQRASYPFLWCQTTEEDRLIREQRALIDPDVKFFKWDIVSGVQTFVNPNGDESAWMWQAVEDEVQDPQAALEFVQQLPEDSIIFMLDYHKYFQDITVIRQALNIKDHLKQSSKMIVFLSAVMGIPLEMKEDIHRNTLDRLCLDTGLDMPDDAEAVVEACAALTQEGAENALAKSLVDNGRFVYTDVLEKKAGQLKGTGYLKFGTHTETFNDLFGLEYMKAWALKSLASKKRKPKGILIYGVPGAGKSHFIKALANELKRPCLEMSFSGLRGGLVGDTERNTDDCLKKIESFGNAIVIADEIDKSIEGIEGSASDGGNSTRIWQSWMVYQEDRTSDTFWAATCNKLETIRTWSGGALMDRWNCVFFVDMPTPEECKGIAKIWSEKEDVDIPEDYDFEGFSGRGIKKLAQQMAMLDCGVDEARRYIIPIMESDPQLIKNIRANARKSCIWASEEQEIMSVKRRIKI